MSGRHNRYRRRYDLHHRKHKLVDRSRKAYKKARNKACWRSFRLAMIPIICDMEDT